jgi:hypothetical protein
LEVFQLMGQGMPTSDLARTLHLSVKTIASHRANMMLKLNIQTSHDLVCYALQFAQDRSALTGEDAVGSATKPSIRSELRHHLSQALELQRRARVMHATWGHLLGLKRLGRKDPGDERRRLLLRFSTGFRDAAGNRMAYELPQLRSSSDRT